MYETVIPISSIKDDPTDFTNLFKIRNRVDSYKRIRFDFSGCRTLWPNAVAFLGGLARLIKLRGGHVTFDWNSIDSPEFMANLCQNGFARAFGYPSVALDGNAIPYREDRKLEMNEIMDYLTYSWIGKGWVHVSSRLRDAIAGRMWEIYNNAFEHSETTIGVYSCGQHFPSMNRLILTVVDFGRGIPEKIRHFVGSDPRALTLPASACLNWAFKRGNTTSTGDVARGLGLDLLKEFVELNQGKLEVYSNEGYVIIDKDGERYENRDIFFRGTIVHVTLCCDEKLYHFSDEEPVSLSKRRNGR